ncbi:MAG: hypothetical protein IJ213_05560 [Bacteroidales bacterium]|nr:hypothetical protein [Bacteroidales bacterium]MBQ9312497.1 hypothetical protein [Bacteroidales bacterium]
MKKEDKKTNATATKTTVKKSTAKTTSTKKQAKNTESETKSQTKTAKKTVKNIDKKRLIVSYERLPEQARLAFDEMYIGDSYIDHMQKQEIPGRDPLYLVPFETEDAIYMVKVEVRVDDRINDEDLEKDVFSDEDTNPDVSLDSGKNPKNFELVHGGDYSDLERAVEQQATHDMTEEQDIDFDTDIM